MLCLKKREVEDLGKLRTRSPSNVFGFFFSVTALLAVLGTQKGKVEATTVTTGSGEREHQ